MNEEIAKHVALGPAERMVLSDEVVKAQKLFKEMFDVLEDDGDAAKLQALWDQIGFPVNYISTVLNMRFHEAFHKTQGGGHVHGTDC